MKHWCRRIATLAEQTACRVSVYGEERTLRAVEGAWQAERRSLSADFHKFTPAAGLAGVAARTRMLIVPAALGSSSSSADGRNALTLSDR